MKPHGAKALNGFTGKRTNPHLNKRGACNCDCRRCAEDNGDGQCICPDCAGGDACMIHKPGEGRTDG